MRHRAGLLEIVLLATASLVTGSLAVTPASAQTARPDARTVERLASLAELYAAVEFFHPDVASAPVARRAWNEAMAVAVEAVAGGDAAVFEGAIRRLVSSIGDRTTTVIGASDPAPARAMEGVERRALRTADGCNAAASFLTSRPSSPSKASGRDATSPWRVPWRSSRRRTRRRRPEGSDVSRAAAEPGHRAGLLGAQSVTMRASDALFSGSCRRPRHANGRLTGADDAPVADQ